MNGDITSILRLDGWAGRIVLAFYGVGTTIVAVLNLDGLVQPVLGILALALLWAGLVFLGVPRGEPLGLPWTIAVIDIVAVGTALGAVNVADGANPGFANWPLGAMTFLLFVLALRGRRMFAWIGFAALALVSVVIALVAGNEVVPVINDIARQAATLLIGTLFALVLRRATRTIAAIQGTQLRLATMAAATEAAMSESAAQSYRLEQDARPTLERIIDPEPFSQTDLWRLAALDASLREGIQQTGFSSEAVSSAVRSARNRGLSVTLVDERANELSPGQRGRLEAALVPLLLDTRNGSITARLHADDATDVASILVEEDGRLRRVLVSA